ncbi:hypothetical protein PFDG_00084 [Plasmodium falciparum Dd2]|uniref:Rifin n=1 Tax=Plasmodium falciparum (isolate Dd2) TaxID=57267 RepID=A0A0L7LVW2_PLAF4|nr:hypothetical protein PFDG_00084 [Plasmodium falciparum Dd2]
MKFNFPNILLFSLPLNIILLSSQVYNQRNHYITRTPKATTRTLCECELYAPSNYDSDPEMKRVMQQFVDRTTQRFHEYDQRMKTTRQKCKDKCDEAIQKIILKDKMEKQMAQQLTTLETKIDTNDIPTCVCEKSMTDKVEKGCLRCGGVLGGGIAPTFGLIGSVAINMWKTTEIAAVIAAAEKFGAAKGAAAGIQAGIKAVMNVLGSDFGLSIEGVKALGTFIDATNYNNGPFIYQAIYTKFQMSSCLPSVSGAVPRAGPVLFASHDQAFCNLFWKKFVPNGHALGIDAIKNNIETYVQKIVSEAETTAGMAAEKAANQVTSAAIKTNTAAVDATYASCQTVIIASVVAILVIVLVMVIIYLILRYRRKKKMKKKLQYIKLLKE